MARPSRDDIRVIVEHRRAKFDYEVEETLEAGLVLRGTEVKALRDGQGNLADAYAMPHGDELYLENMHIGAYKPAGVWAHLPTRRRKLLMHKGEIRKWSQKARERGLTMIPLSVYLKAGRMKVMLGLCKGRKHEDRRQTIKERETRRELDKVAKVR